MCAAAAAAPVCAPLCTHAGRWEQHWLPQWQSNLERTSRRCPRPRVTTADWARRTRGPAGMGTSERARWTDSLSALPTGLEARAQASTYRRCSPSPV